MIILNHLVQVQASLAHLKSDIIYITLKWLRKLLLLTLLLSYSIQDNVLKHWTLFRLEILCSNCATFFRTIKWHPSVLISHLSNCVTVSSRCIRNWIWAIRFVQKFRRNITTKRKQLHHYHERCDNFHHLIWSNNQNSGSAVHAKFWI
jgi:hypothetical protein